MKRLQRFFDENTTAKNVFLVIGNIAIVYFAVYCTFGAFLSSFSLEPDTSILYTVWFLGVVAVSVLTILYGSKGILLALIPAALLFLRFRTEIIEGGGYVINYVTESFNEWLSVTVLFPEYSEFSDEMTFFIAAAGVMVILQLAYAVCIRRSVFLTALSTVPFVFLTFVITNMQADFIYLLGLIAIYLALLISSAVNPDDFTKRGLFLIPAFILSVFLMIFAYAFAPAENYSREDHVIALNNHFRNIAVRIGQLGRFWQIGTGNTFSEIGWLVSNDGVNWYFNTDNFNVADAGSRSFTNQSLLEITVDTPGVFYIRGYSLQNFDGRTWSISENMIRQQASDMALMRPSHILNAYSVSGLPNAPVFAEMSVTRTGDMTPIITYQPYYKTTHRGPGFSAGIEHFYHAEGSIHRFTETMTSVVIIIENVNTGHMLEIIEEFPIFSRAYRGAGFFEFSRYDTTINYEELMDDVSYVFPDIVTDYSIIYPNDVVLSGFMNLLRIPASYTGIDPVTASELRRIAFDAGIDINGDRIDIVDSVANFIRSSAEYTLTPGPVPEGEDFVLYFLTELQEGYCIHFATAAVMMLRALNIPARFTGGYIVTVPGNNVNSNIILTDRNAHAWVEVFYEDAGWLYLEVTPSGSLSLVPPARPHSPQAERPRPPMPPQLTPDETNGLPPETDMPDPGEVSSPGGGAGTGVRAWNIPGWMTDTLIIIMCVLSIVPILFIRRLIILSIRSANFNREDTNEAIIYIWRFVLRLCRREAVPPDDIEELALKARFSQHRMTEEERIIMIKYVQRLAFEVYTGKGDYGRLYIKYIRAFY